MRFYGEIQRIDEEQRMVWGYASTEQRATDGKVISRRAMEGALDAYMEYANLREMHQSSAVGRTDEARVDDGGLWIGAKVVDDVAWKKVIERVYKGFSVGAKITEYDPIDRTLITAMELREISLVDRPADPGAKIDLYRADGFDGDEDDDIPTSAEAAPAADLEEDTMSRAPARKPAAAAAAPAAETVERVEGDAPAAAAADEAPAAEPAPAADAAPEAEAQPEPVVEAAPAAEGEAPADGEAERAAAADAEPEQRADLVDRALQAADAASQHVDASLTAVERVAAGEEAPAAVMALDATPEAEVRRSMGMVSRLGYLLGELAYIIADAQFEAEIEGDNSPVPDKLRDGLKTLASAFKTMSDEEVAELLASVSATASVDGAIIMFAASGADLERSADATITTEQGEQLQAFLEACIARGWAPELPGADENDLQRQVTALTTDRDKLLGSVEKLTGEMTRMAARIDAVVAPAKTAGALARAIDKGEDSAGVEVEPGPHVVTEDDVQRALAAMPEQERALLLTRAALARPIPVTGR